MVGSSYFCTVDGSTVPERPFPRGTSGASAILWAVGDRPRPVASAMLSSWWATAISAEIAAFQLALAWLVATPLSARPGFADLWTAVLSLPQLDSWFLAPEYACALAVARPCSFPALARRIGLADKFDLSFLGVEADEGWAPPKRIQKSGPTAGTSTSNTTAAKQSHAAHSHFLQSAKFDVPTDGE